MFRKISIMRSVQERDSNITFVTNFSCLGAWNRDFLMKIGSRWTQNWKNGSSRKIMIFFIFCLYISKKWKKSWFLGLCGFIFHEKTLKNHDFWIFVVAQNAKIVFFLHFWFFSYPKNRKKRIFKKCNFFFKFQEFSLFFDVFHVFCLQNPFLLSKF